MGIRSLTIVKSRWDEGDWQTNAIIYCSGGGYPDAHGKDLAAFLDGLHLVNGISPETPRKHANGPGRLAAQLVAFLSDVGHDPDLMAKHVNCWHEYEYHIMCQFGAGGGTVDVTVYDGPVLEGKETPRVLFIGTSADFINWVRK